jgi:hypothetical protein
MILRDQKRCRPARSGPKPSVTCRVRVHVVFPHVNACVQSHAHTRTYTCMREVVNQYSQHPRTIPKSSGGIEIVAKSRLTKHSSSLFLVRISIGQDRL